MTWLEQWFFWWGVAVNAVGGAAILGLIAWGGLEWWINFNTIRKPLIRWYAEQLRAKHEKKRAGYGA